MEAKSKMSGKSSKQEGLKAVKRKVSIGTCKKRRVYPSGSFLRMRKRWGVSKNDFRCGKDQIGSWKEMGKESRKGRKGFRLWLDLFQADPRRERGP